MNFRSFCESRAYCGLSLSPLMAAIADASDGIAPTLSDETCIAHFGCTARELPRETRRTVAVRAGGRGGKTSRLLAPKAIHAAWTVPLPTLRSGEVASAIIVAPDLKLARQALSFVRGYVDDSPILRRAVKDDPTKDSVTLKRPDGKVVRIEVLAASRGGRAVRGRTLVFAGLDEACFFYDEASGVVNDVELYRALLQRVVPGGQVWIVSTPWIADVGLLETTIAKNWATHGHALVATAGTRALNPTWDPTGEIERDLREQDPDAASREIDALPMGGGAGAFFDPFAITQCIDDARPMGVPPRSGLRVWFGADLAFERDSSAIVGVSNYENRFELVAIEELRPRPGNPLQPKQVIDTFAPVVKAHGARVIMADAHYRQSAREHLQRHELELVDVPAGQRGKNESYLHAKKLLHEGRIVLPRHPRLIAQLRATVSKPQPGGGMKIDNPRRRHGGGHGDLVSAWVLAVWQGRADAGWNDTTATLEDMDLLSRPPAVSRPGDWNLLSDRSGSGFRDRDGFSVDTDFSTPEWRRPPRTKWD